MIQLDQYKVYRNTNEFIVLIAKLFLIFALPLHNKMGNLYDIFVKKGDSVVDICNLQMIIWIKHTTCCISVFV
jgi:hypothetical protein